MTKRASPNSLSKGLLGQQTGAWGPSAQADGPWACTEQNRSLPWWWLFPSRQLVWERDAEACASVSLSLTPLGTEQLVAVPKLFELLCETGSAVTRI